MQTALITGATGFVGGRVATQLRLAGWSVVAIHRPSTSKANIETLASMGATTVACTSQSDVVEIFDRTSPGVVFHLAAHQERDRPGLEVDDFIESNISLGTYLLESAAEHGAVVVNALSYFQFADSQPAPFSLYSATKQAFYDIAEYYRIHRSVDVRNVVLFDNYGANDARNKLISQLVAAAASGGHLAVGPREQPINLLNVNDVAEGLIAASQTTNRLPTVAIRASELVTVGDVVKVIQTISGERFSVSHDEAAPISRRVENAGSWPAPMGWAPQIDLETGLREAYDSALAKY